MTPDEDAAQAVVDIRPDAFASAVTGRVSLLTRTYSGQAVVGLRSARVRIRESELECDWLRGFETAVIAGAAREGSLVLIHLVGGQCVIADVIVIGAKPLG